MKEAIYMEIYSLPEAVHWLARAYWYEDGAPAS